MSGLKYSELAAKLIPFLPAAGGGGGGSSGGATSGSLPISSYPEALLRDGTRALIGNLAVSAGVTIDGVDLGQFYVDFVGRLMTAGNGLTGGGTLAADRTFNVGAGAGISVSSDAVAVDQGFGFSWTATHAFALKPIFSAGAYVSLAQVLTFGYGAGGSVDLSRTADGTLTATTAFFASGYAIFDAGSIRARGSTSGVEIFDRSAGTPVSWQHYANAGIFRLWNPTYGDVIYSDGRGTVRSPSYASQATGGQVDFSDGSADLRYLFVDEMHAKSFIADLEQALAGGQIICKSVMMLYQPFTAPAAGAAATLTLKDLPSAPGMLGFQAADFVRVRTFARAGLALTIGDCWGTVQVDLTYVRTLTITATGGTFTLNSGTTTAAIAYNAAPAAVVAALEALASIGVGDVQVTGAPGAMTIRFVNALLQSSVPLSVNTGGLTGGSASIAGFSTDSDTATQRWTLTRSAGADAGAMAAGTVVQPNAVILDYGVSGNGFYEVNAIDGAAAVNSPYFQIVTWTTHPRNSVVRLRGGRLSGIGGGANEYGLFVGDGAMTPGTNRYIRISSTHFEVSNLDITLWRAGVRRFYLETATPFFAMGPVASGTPAYLGGNGFFVGDNGAGVYRLHIGVAAAGVLSNGLSFDGSALVIKSAQGAITLNGSGLMLEYQSGLLAQRHSAINWGEVNAGTRVFHALSTVTDWYLTNSNGSPSYAVASYIKMTGNTPWTFEFNGGGVRTDALVPRYATWNDYGVGDGGAAIYNDNDIFDALMIAGNNSAGGNRVVRVYDQLIVANYVLSENSQGFTGRREGTQSIANATWTTVSGTHDDIDNYNLYDGVSFTVPTTGFYIVTGKVTWASNATGNRIIAILNNSTGVYLYTDNLRGGATGEVHHSISAVLYLTAGHAIRLAVWQDSGAALNIGHASDANFYPRFGAHRLN